MYTVFVQDNSEAHDGKPAREIGAFVSYADATAAAQRVVERSLSELQAGSNDAEELMQSYSMFGEDAYILPDDAGGFSSFEYARSVCVNRFK